MSDTEDEIRVRAMVWRHLKRGGLYRVLCFARGDFAEGDREELEIAFSSDVFEILSETIGVPFESEVRGGQHIVRVTMQASGPPETDIFLLYAPIGEPQIYMRCQEEFLDGRFEPVQMS